MTDRDESLDDFWDDFNVTAEHLRQITIRARSLGSRSMFITALIIITSIAISAMRAENFTSGKEHFLNAVLLASLAAFNVLYLYRLERLLRRGDALFEELTEELQYRISQADATRASSLRPPARGRIVMREYPQSRTLPFIPTRNAPALLLVLTIVFAVIPFLTLAIVKTTYY